MKFLTLASTTSAATAVHASLSLRDQFEDFTATFNKSYATTEEKEYRFNVFLETVARISNLNIQHPTVAFGINQFADLTEEEQNDIMTRGFLNGRPDSLSKDVEVGPMGDFSNLPKTVDHSTCYPQVRDQGQCGSCWAFSTVAAVEGAYCKQFNEQVSLSPQHLVDCDKEQVGCNGAYTLTEPFEFVRKNGLCAEKDYPYKARDQRCASKDCQARHSVTQWKDLSGSKAADVMAYLDAHGPMSVGVAAGRNFQLYKGGVMSSTECPAGSMNHAVTLVGYEVEADGQVAFKIMNSWGGRWGEKGFIRVRWGACRLGAMLTANDAKEVTDFSAEAEERM